MGGIVALAIALPLGLGLWLDKRLGTAPLLALAGVIVGILVATIGTVRIAGRTIEALGTVPEIESSVEEEREED
jgi:F0F1-type ATP synthase assembly protein I